MNEIHVRGERNGPSGVLPTQHAAARGRPVHSLPSSYHCALRSQVINQTGLSQLYLYEV